MSSEQKKAWDAVLYGNRWCFLTSSPNPTGKHTQRRRKDSAGCEQKSNFNLLLPILSAQMSKLMALNSWKQGSLRTHQHYRFAQHLSWRGIGTTPNLKEFLDIQNWNILCLWWLNFIQFQLHTWTIKLQPLISVAGSICYSTNRTFTFLLLRDRLCLQSHTLKEQAFLIPEKHSLLDHRGDTNTLSSLSKPEQQGDFWQHITACYFEHLCQWHHF